MSGRTREKSPQEQILARLALAQDQRARSPVKGNRQDDRDYRQAGEPQELSLEASVDLIHYDSKTDDGPDVLYIDTAFDQGESGLASKATSRPSVERYLLGRSQRSRSAPPPGDKVKLGANFPYNERADIPNQFPREDLGARGRSPTTKVSYGKGNQPLACQSGRCYQCVRGVDGPDRRESDYNFQGSQPFENYLH